MIAIRSRAAARTHLHAERSLGRLPGIGPRSAERLALHLVQTDAEAVRHLAQTLVQAREKIRACAQCGALTESSPCAICSDPRRDPALLCVVERPLDIFALEKAGSFKGRYHVLGGKISPLNGVEPEDCALPNWKGAWPAWRKSSSR